LAIGSVPPKVQLVAPQPPEWELAVKLGPNVMLLAKTEASLKPEVTDAAVELTGKSQASSRRLCAKELEHIPKEMIAQKREKILKLPTIKIILTKVSNFASG